MILISRSSQSAQNTLSYRQLDNRSQYTKADNLKNKSHQKSIGRNIKFLKRNSDSKLS